MQSKRYLVSLGPKWLEPKRLEPKWLRTGAAGPRAAELLLNSLETATETHVSPILPGPPSIDGTAVAGTAWLLMVAFADIPTPYSNNNMTLSQYHLSARCSPDQILAQ